MPVSLSRPYDAALCHANARLQRRPWPTEPPPAQKPSAMDVGTKPCCADAEIVPPYPLSIGFDATGTSPYVAPNST